MDGSISSSIVPRCTTELLLGKCPLCGTQLEARTSRTPMNPNNKFVKCPNLEHTPYAYRFFVGRSVCAIFGQWPCRSGTSDRTWTFNVEAMSSMGIEGLELKGFAAVGRMLVYLTVVQACC
uniref:Uncharacterized protein n=1 Tax=Oryza rufipogon TaxID=4529 RepID=A0A0E0PHN3_ORYRU